jgi:hypothetical protein
LKKKKHEKKYFRQRLEPKPIVWQYNHQPDQRRTGHGGNAMLVAGALTIFHTKCLKSGFLRAFWIFLYEMSQGPFDLSPPLYWKVGWLFNQTKRHKHYDKHFYGIIYICIQNIKTQCIQNTNICKKSSTKYSFSMDSGFGNKNGFMMAGQISDKLIFFYCKYSHDSLCFNLHSSWSSIYEINNQKSYNVKGKWIDKK